MNKSKKAPTAPGADQVIVKKMPFSFITMIWIVEIIAVVLIVLGIILFDSSWLTGLDLPTFGAIPTWLIIALVVLALGLILYLFKGHVTDQTSSINWKNILYALGALLLLVIIVSWSLSIYDWWNKPKVSSTSEQTTPCSTCTVPDNRPKIRSNHLQLLRAGVKYSWDRKCKTIYYFEPKEVGSTALTYRYDRHPERYLTGEVVRTSDGPNFFAQEGADPMADGIYTVTVENDVWLYVRTD